MRRMTLPLTYCPLESEGDDDAFDLRVTLYGEPIAHIYSTRIGKRVRLEDVRVEETTRGRGPCRCRMLRLIGWWPPKLRGLGIGTDLLRRFLQWADDEGVPEVWGEVTKAALMENRDLLGWYRKHLFKVQDPDAECKLPGVVKKVVRVRPK